MNKYLLLCFFLFSTHTIGAQLRGRYWSHDQWTSETIVFKSFHRFTFEFHGESGNDIGFGKYKLHGDSQVLNFRTGKPRVKAGPEIIHTTITDFGTCDFKIKVVDAQTREPLPFAEVRVAGAAMFQTDENGIGQLKFPANGWEVEIHVSLRWGEVEEVFKITAKGQYDITYPIDQNNERYYKQGDQIIYYLKAKRKRNELHLSKYREDYDATYHRISGNWGMFWKTLKWKRERRKKERAEEG
jgi:hypothetical protein